MNSKQVSLSVSNHSCVSSGSMAITHEHLLHNRNTLDTNDITSRVVSVEVIRCLAVSVLPSFYHNFSYSVETTMCARACADLLKKLTVVESHLSIIGDLKRTSSIAQHSINRE